MAIFIMAALPVVPVYSACHSGVVSFAGIVDVMDFVDCAGDCCRLMCCMHVYDSQDVHTLPGR